MKSIGPIATTVTVACYALKVAINYVTAFLCYIVFRLEIGTYVDPCTVAKHRGIV